MKSELSLRREYRRIEQSRKALAKSDNYSRDALWGALQAIAWALDQNAAAASRCWPISGNPHARRTATRKGGGI